MSPIMGPRVCSFIVLLISISSVLTEQCTSAPRVNPQYIVPHITPADWNYNDPNSITPTLVNDILSTINSRGSSERRLGFGYTISYLDVEHNNLTVVVESINEILSIATKLDIPVMLALDGFEWWDSRPDLWNWFNASAAGYNPANVQNVEWTGWSSNDAIKICWRDWGSQIRVLPHPNVGSPAFIQAQVDALKVLVPPILNWYNSLPAAQKYLFVGIKAGWELAIGSNYYYYANGNDLWDKSPKDDPTTGIKAATQLGYAAVYTLGLAKSGAMTEDLLNAALGNYVHTITETIHALGIPHNKIYTHIGNTEGLFTPPVVGNGALPAVTPYAHPGWSFYSAAYDPSKAPGYSSSFAELDNSPWGTVEWYYLGGNSGTYTQQWEEAFDNSFGYNNNHIVQIYNWDSFKSNASVIAAVQHALAESPCVVEPAAETTTFIYPNNSVMFSWWNGLNGVKVYLNVGTSPDTLPSGALVTANVVNSVLDPSVCSYYDPHELERGTYYWNVVTDGCTAQRMVSEVVSFQTN